MKIINEYEAKELIESSDGKLFSVQFIKKNGDTRNMVCRLGVKKYINGKGLNYDPEHFNLMPVFDVHNAGYRMINLKTMKALKINKEVFVIKNAA